MSLIMSPISLVFGVAMSWFALLATTNAGSADELDVPLPPDVRISKAPDGVPAAVASYVGKWTGRWDGLLPHILVVEEVDANGSVICVYAWGDHPQGRFERGFIRISGVISGKELKLSKFQNGAVVRYRMNPDGTLHGTYTLPDGEVSRVFMTRSKE